MERSAHFPYTDTLRSLGESGTFQADGEDRAFGPGDALFVAAGVEHRFVDHTPDLTVCILAIEARNRHRNQGKVTP